MTPSQLPVGLQTQQTIAAFYRAGYPIEEIADAIGLSPSTCEDLVDAMRRVGWTLRRPRGAHEHIQVDNAFLRAHYLSRRAQARRRRERLSLSELARVAGLAKPGREPDPTWIGRLLRLTPMPDGAMRTHIPLGLALALGRALGLDPREVEAREIRPQPARFHAPRHGLPVIARVTEETVAVAEAEPLAVAA
jgi:transcriptional regulator with XRE-family HTH domain